MTTRSSTTGPLSIGERSRYSSLSYVRYIHLLPADRISENPPPFFLSSQIYPINQLNSSYLISCIAFKPIGSTQTQLSQSHPSFLQTSRTPYLQANRDLAETHVSLLPIYTTKHRHRSIDCEDIVDTGLAGTRGDDCTRPSRTTTATQKARTPSSLTCV